MRRRTGARQKFRHWRRTVKDYSRNCRRKGGVTVGGGRFCRGCTPVTVRRRVGCNVPTSVALTRVKFRDDFKASQLTERDSGFFKIGRKDS